MSFLHFDCRFRYTTGFELNFQFQAENGITAIIGSSGIGKTTVLHLIAGLLRPSRGSITLGTQVLCDTARGICLPPEQRHVGLVFQDYQLFPHLTVRENLAYGAKRNPQAKVDLKHLLEVLELGSLLDRYPASMSGGQRQRTALGRAILAAPQILLLDEPLSASDEALRASIATYLQRTFAEYPIPTLLVTHDLSSVETLAQQIVRL